MREVLASAATPQVTAGARAINRPKSGMPQGCERRRENPIKRRFEIPEKIRHGFGFLGSPRPHHQDRTHRSLDQDCPLARPVEPPNQGNIIALPRLGGLHHRYARQAA